MKRVLCIYFSQSGQLGECLDSLTRPLKALEGVEVETLVLSPKKAYPYPWTFFRFFDVFPEAYLEVPPAMETPEMELNPGDYDLVILGYHVWFLKLSLPMLGFLHTMGAKVLEGTPVVMVNACRNMWHRAWFQASTLVRRLGGRIIGHVVLIDQGPASATFLTTPLWLFTGQKQVIRSLPAAGVSTRDIDSLEAVGDRLAVALEKDELDECRLVKLSDEVPEVSGKYMLPEKFGLLLFWPWAKLARLSGRLWYGLRYPMEFLFFLSLFFSILVIVPLCLVGSLVLRLFFQGRVGAYLSSLHNPFATEKGST
ncbi:hypothetical protein [Desulfoluna butyratoxydans]|uniref:Flavoprotein-like domain n=1 Tax=Desulfoluna butyratoxydans TaxID=231438 RepID=A0A4U8YSY7_9BACT|nr:hypothetical protein [Desulfoluna butyratoxydans]VFQ44413.1 flavoprotein-like domain [Desulfoluna butyratoxydans]